MQDCIFPEKFRKIVGGYHCLREFNQCMVHPFGNTILWRWIWHSITNFHTMCLAPIFQFLVYEFFPTITGSSNVPDNLLWLVLCQISAWCIQQLQISWHCPQGVSSIDGHKYFPHKSICINSLALVFLIDDFGNGLTCCFASVHAIQLGFGESSSTINPSTIFLSSNFWSPVYPTCPKH